VGIRTISVREAAEALDLSPRAVLYRREKGKLKGILVKNNGIDEYRIYPNKEIIEGLKRIGSPLVAELLGEEESGTGQAESEVETLTARLEELEAAFKRSSVEEPRPRDQKEARIDDDSDHIDVDVDIVGESISSNEGTAESDSKISEGSEAEAKPGVNGIVDEIWNNLIARYQVVIGEKDQIIGALQEQLEEKDRQLKLLPDKQASEIEEARRRADEERKNAERNARELEQERQRREEERAKGDAERARAEEKARQVEEERLRAEEEKKNVELKELEIQALKKQVEVMSSLKESTEASRLAVEEELQRTKVEKEEKERAVQEELKTLAKKLEELERPWYKKWFSWQQPVDDTQH